jgi:hypothetical protein
MLAVSWTASSGIGGSRSSEYLLMTVPMPHAAAEAIISRLPRTNGETAYLHAAAVHDLVSVMNNLFNTL